MICRLAATNNAILPGMEAFEMLEKIPGVYLIFYDYFFKLTTSSSRPLVTKGGLVRAIFPISPHGWDWRDKRPLGCWP